MVGLWWAYTNSFSYTVDTTLTIYCTQIVQPKFVSYSTVGPYLLILGHSGPIPSRLLTQWVLTSPSTVHRLSSLSSSLTGTVGPYLLILSHSGPIPPHLLTQWAPPAPCTVHRLSSLGSSLTCTVGPYLLILWQSGPTPSFSYTVGTTLEICCTHTVQPHFPLPTV